MSTIDTTVGKEIPGLDAVGDLSSFLESLSARLREPSAKERWYPGSSAAWVDIAALPYYRVPAASSMAELLEAALVRPAGIRLDFEDWLESFEAQRRTVRMHAEARSVSSSLRIALSGAISGGVLAVGCGLVALTLLNHAYRPNAYIALAVALGGGLLVTSVAVAIWERRWRAAR